MVGFGTQQCRTFKFCYCFLFHTQGLQPGNSSSAYSSQRTNIPQFKVSVTSCSVRSALQFFHLVFKSSVLPPTKRVIKQSKIFNYSMKLEDLPYHLLHISVERKTSQVIIYCFWLNVWVWFHIYSHHTVHDSANLTWGDSSQVTLLTINMAHIPKVSKIILCGVTIKI
jgi:hypothetical protein